MNQNWLVAVDDTPFSYYAFKLTVDNMSKKDRLFLVSVSQDPSKSYFSTASDIKSAVKKQDAVVTKLLAYYQTKAVRKGIDMCTMILAHGGHIGDVLCSVIDTFHIDQAVLGRRNVADVSRLLVGSSSRYVVENANCNVLVVKQPLGGREITQSFLDPKLTRYSLETFGKKERVMNEEREIKLLLDGRIALPEDHYLLYSFYQNAKSMVRKEVYIATMKTADLEKERLERDKAGGYGREKEKRDTKEMRDSKDVRDSKDMRDSRDVKDSKDSKDVRDSRDTMERTSEKKSFYRDESPARTKFDKDSERREKEMKKEKKDSKRGKLAWRKKKDNEDQKSERETRDTEVKSDSRGEERGTTTTTKVLVE